MDERTAFENYMTDGGTWPKSVVRGRDGQYLLAQTAAAWTVWQARAAQPEPAAPTVVEPVLFIHPSTLKWDKGHVGAWKPGYELPGYIPLYATAPRAALTNGEIYTAYIAATNQTLRAVDEKLALAFARAVEAAHGIGGPK